MATKAEEYLNAYGEHSKVLRTWLVAYGIGAPVVLVTNESVSRAMKSSGRATVIAIAFLIGVALQVILATLNKVSMFALYYGEENSSYKTSHSFRFAYWFSESFWIDVLVDVATLVMFMIATWKALAILIA
jgi:hypothetical protein